MLDVGLLVVRCRIRLQFIDNFVGYQLWIALFKIDFSMLRAYRQGLGPFCLHRIPLDAGLLNIMMRHVKQKRWTIGTLYQYFPFLVSSCKKKRTCIRIRDPSVPRIDGENEGKQLVIVISVALTSSGLQVL